VNRGGVTSHSADVLNWAGDTGAVSGKGKAFTSYFLGLSSTSARTVCEAEHGPGGSRDRQAVRHRRYCLCWRYEHHRYSICFTCRTGIHQGNTAPARWHASRCHQWCSSSTQHQGTASCTVAQAAPSTPCQPASTALRTLLWLKQQCLEPHS
jgi:hypothetical protein